VDSLKKKNNAVVEASLLPPERLDFWLKKRYNVLLEGKHGVGKTSVVLDAFKRNKLRWICLSGATMDPFIDFVGVPVKMKTPKGEQVIDLLRPKYIQDANPQAIFIDEFNRSHKKVRNAVMELLQFKTINGQKIGTDLRVVWAAINPDDDAGTYDVDKLDPAQRDRFHIHTEIPYICDRKYFNTKFGEKLASAAIRFWMEIPEAIREKVSPRRLDYALGVMKDGGDIRDVLPMESNPSRLLSIIKIGLIESQLTPLLKRVNAAREWLSDEENYVAAIWTIIDNKKFNSLLDEIPDEKKAALFPSNLRARRLMVKSLRKLKSKSPFFKPLSELYAANQNTKMVNILKRYLPKVRAAKASGSLPAALPGTFTFPSGPISIALTKLLTMNLGHPVGAPKLCHAASLAKRRQVKWNEVLNKLTKLNRTWAAHQGLTIDINNAPVGAMLRKK
jgi:hypothetical protein